MPIRSASFRLAAALAVPLLAWSAVAIDPLGGQRASTAWADDPPAADSVANAEVSSDEATQPNPTSAEPAAAGPDMAPLPGNVTAGPIASKIRRYAERVIARHDLDGDESLTEIEWAAMRGEPQKADLDGDGRVTVDEFARRVAEFALRRSLWLVASDEALGLASPDPPGPADFGTPGAANKEEIPPATMPARGDRRFFVPTARLPQGLPEWFVAADKDGDSQLTLSEFTSVPAAGGADAFGRYDLNADGILTGTEYLVAEKRRAEANPPAPNAEANPANGKAGDSTAEKN